MDWEQTYDSEPFELVSKDRVMCAVDKFKEPRHEIPAVPDERTCQLRCLQRTKEQCAYVWFLEVDTAKYEFDFAVKNEMEEIEKTGDHFDKAESAREIEIVKMNEDSESINKGQVIRYCFMAQTCDALMQLPGEFEPVSLLRRKAA